MSTVAASSSAALLASQWALPPELIIHVFECFIALPREAGHQRDLLRLSRACKLFHALATPRLFAVIDLHDSKKIMSLINAIRADPKRAEAARAVWWHLGGQALSKSSERRNLVTLPNVEEVAWYARQPVSGFPMGCHVSLRDVGPWCGDEFVPAPPVLRAQGTPTLPGQTPSVMALAEPVAGPRDAPYERPKRAVWAVSLVVDSLGMWAYDLLKAIRTVTHLTITLYSDACLAGDMQEFDEHLSLLLRPLYLPLLEHIVIRVTNFGGAAANVRRENRNRKLRELCESMQDYRLRLEEMPPFKSKRDIVADVVEYTHHQWMQRAYGSGLGPWTSLKTTQPRIEEPQDVGEVPQPNDIWAREIAQWKKQLRERRVKDPLYPYGPQGELEE